MSRRLVLVGLACLLVLTGIGASCSGRNQEPTVPEIAEARLPRADLRLLVITDLLGYLEPCGCTSRPLGGIDRLAAQVRDLRDDGTPTLFLAAGDLFFDATTHGVELPEAATQEIWKAETVAEVLSGLDLAAAAPGPTDLRFGTATFRSVREHARFPLLAAGASMAIPGEDPAVPSAPTPFPGHVIREVGGIRVGIIGISDIEGTDVTAAADPIEAARAATRAARSEGAQLVIALARLPRRTVRRMASEIEGLDFIVQSGLDSEEANLPASDQGAAILHAAHHGTGVLVLDVMRGEGDRWTDASAWTRTAERDRLRHEIDERRARIAEWERDPQVAATDLEDQRASLRELDAQLAALSRAPEIRGRAFSARFVELPPEAARDAAVTTVLDTYFRRVNQHNREVFASVLPRPAAEGQPSYVGTEACGSCHAEELAWWRTTMHGHAYRTLEEVNKEFNLSCVGCHVTGYNRPGGSTVAHVGALEDVGCENCHGPGSQHLADPAGAIVNVRRDAREEVCSGCHNREHSDRFTYPVYRRMMIAPGHGMPATGT